MISSKFLCPDCLLSSGLSTITRAQQARSLYTRSRPLSNLERCNPSFIVSPAHSAQSSLRSLGRSFSESQKKTSIFQSLSKGNTAETYVSYGLTQKLFEACSSQADYQIPQVAQKSGQPTKTDNGEDIGVGEGWWFSELNLLPTFSTWSQVTFLHMYLLTVRLRALPSPESVRTHSRHLFDHFSHNAEHRMATLHDISSRGIRNKYLKDLFIQWRGVLAAYDEGLVKGDAVLGAAVWRNIWKGSSKGHDGQDIDWAKVATVVAYMRRVLVELSKVEEADLVSLVQKSGTQSSIFGFKEVDSRLARKD